MNNDLPVTLNFNNADGAYAWVQLTERAKALTNLHEYFLSPTYRRNDDGDFTLEGYGLIHRTQLPTMEGLDKKYGKGNY